MTLFKRYITIYEAALLLNRGPHTIWRYMREGKLKKVKILNRTYVGRKEVQKMLEPK